MYNFLLFGQSNSIQIYQYFLTESKARYGQNNVNIMGCGLGGTSILEWQKSGLLYSNMINSINNQPIHGAFFLQGEADTHSLDAAQNWAIRAKQLFLDLRSDTISDLPIIMTQIGRIPDPSLLTYPYWPLVWHQQYSFDINSGSYENAMGRVKMVGTMTLETKDLVHHPPAAYVSLSKWLLNKWENVVNL